MKVEKLIISVNAKSYIRGNGNLERKSYEELDKHMELANELKMSDISDLGVGERVSVNFTLEGLEWEPQETQAMVDMINTICKQQMEENHMRFDTHMADRRDQRMADERREERAHQETMAKYNQQKNS